MRSLQVLLVCFVSAAPWDRTDSVIIHQKKEGTRFRIEFFFSSPKSLKFFCKRRCEEGDVLVKTEQNQGRSGRFSTGYQELASGGGVLSVTISNLTKPDSGRYRFGVGGSLVPDSFRDFEIRVVEASEDELNIHSRDEGGNVSVLCHFFSPRTTKLFCRNTCNQGDVLLETTEDQARSDRYSITYEAAGAKFLLRVSVSELRASDSGLYACGLGESVSSASLQRFEIRVSGASSHVPQLVSFLLVCAPVAVGLLAAVLMFLHRLRTKTSSGAGTTEVTLLAVAYEHDMDDDSFHPHPGDFTLQEPETLSRLHSNTDAVS